MNELHPEVQIVRVMPGDSNGFECLIQLLTMLHAETPHAPLCPDRLRESVREAMDAEGSWIFASVLPDGRMAGTVALTTTAPFFSRQLWLRDLWLFVHPECRRTPHARMLVRAAKLMAEKMKLPLHMEISGYGGRIAGKVRLYARELGEPNGAAWNLPAPQGA
jgi:GNAT superfamily N-acetyltransferase